MIRHIPNLLTLGRALSVPLLVWILVLEEHAPAGSYTFEAALVFFIAALTDMIDGWLARELDVVSRVGKLIDPLADKVIVLAALVMLTGLGRLEAWIVVVIMAREFAVNMLRNFAVEDGVVLPAGRGGKIKTFVQMAGINLLLLYNDYWGLPIAATGRVLIYASAVIAWVSGIQYFVAYFRGEPAHT